MKISTQTLMLLGNPQHADFGTYARFVTGMGKEVEVGDRVKLCEKCFRPRIDTAAIPICLYCRGVEGTIKDKGLQGFVNHHIHDFSKSRRNNPCKICGVFKSFIAVAIE